MTERPSSPVDRSARLAALQDRSAASRRRSEPPAQISKIVTTGLAASLTLGLVTVMGWSSADADIEPAAPTAPPAVGAGSVPVGVEPLGPATVPPATAVVELPTSVAGPLVTAVPVVVTEPVPAPTPAPAPAPVVIDLAVPTPAPAPAAPAAGGGSGGGSSNGSTKQSK